MNVSNIASIATSLSNQRASVETGVAAVKMANNQMEAQGKSVLELIASVPTPQGSLGHHIDVRA